MTNSFSQKLDLSRLTEEEKGALLDYKSSWSYIINSALRDGSPMDQETRRKVEALDRAIRKLPVYRGTVYRRVSFDGVGGQEALEAFLAEHQLKSGVPYPSFTSTSKTVDGYPMKGELTVTMVIESVSGRDADGIGNNFEQEVLFARDTDFLVTRLEKDEAGHSVIYMREVAKNGTGQLHPEADEMPMQRVQEAGGFQSDLPEVSAEDPARGPGGDELPGV